MSSRRIVASSISMAAVLLATGVYGSSMLPLKAAPAVPRLTAFSQQAPPRDRRPGEAGPETARERELKQLSRDRVQRRRNITSSLRGSRKRAALSPKRRRRWWPPRGPRSANTPRRCWRRSIAGPAASTWPLRRSKRWRRRSRRRRRSIRSWRRSLGEGVEDSSLSDAQKRAYIDLGIEASDRALAVQDNYVDAIVYKSILVRQKANLEADATSRQTLLAQADALRTRALELQRAQGKPNMEFVPAPGQSPLPPPPPPPPPPGVDGMAPVRVGGNIKPPTKVRDVKPIYPADAQDAKVQGVVIIEATD